MKKRFVLLLLSLLLLCSLIFPSTKASAAIKTVKIDSKEYNLYVEDIPSFTSEWNSLFAKLNNISDSSAYALSLFDDSNSSELLIAGLSKANIKVDEDNVYGMDIMIYKAADDGELYPIEGSVDCTIVCPVPDFWIEDAEMLQLYNLSSGKASKYSFELISVGEIPCMRFTINKTGVYGFVLSDSKVESANPTQTPTKTPTTAAPTPVPTKAPTKAPTPIPNKQPAKEEIKATPVPTKAPQKNQSASVQAQTSASNSSKAEQPKRQLDSTPQTGDDSPIGWWALSAGLSAGAIAAILYFLKHSK